MKFVKTINWTRNLDKHWQRARRPDQRRVLINAMVPMNYECIAPVVRAMRDDSRVEFYFTTTSASINPTSIYRDEEIKPRIISPFRAALMRFDAYLTADRQWAIQPRGTRRIMMFHGVAGKHGNIFDNPSPEERSWLKEYQYFFFINQRRMQNYLRSGAIPPDGGMARLVGMPKVDCLVNGTLRRDEILTALGVDPSKRTVLYAPTWTAYSSLNLLGEELVEGLIRAGYTVLLKLHDHSLNYRSNYASGGIDWRRRLAPILQRGGGVFLESADTCRYLAAADLLITDHSSIGFEYMLLDRPVIRIEMPKLIEKFHTHPDYVALLADASHSVRNAGGAVEAVGHSFLDPTLHAESRRAACQELFYLPGSAAARAARELYEIIELDAK